MDGILNLVNFNIVGKEFDGKLVQDESMGGTTSWVFHFIPMSHNLHIYLLENSKYRENMPNVPSDLV